MNRLPKNRFTTTRRNINMKVLTHYTNAIKGYNLETIQHQNTTEYGGIYKQFDFTIEDWGDKYIKIMVVNTNNSKVYNYTCENIHVVCLLIKDFVNRVK